MKRCYECDIDKDESEYYSHPWTKDKLMKMCNACHSIKTNTAPRGIGTPEERRVRTSRNSELKSKYGITIEDYEAMEKAQGDGCALCGGTQVDDRGLAVDHSHKTGKVRGLLCSNCNRALGGFRDDPTLLRKAADYVESNE